MWKLKYKKIDIQIFGFFSIFYSLKLVLEAPHFASVVLSTYLECLCLLYVEVLFEQLV